MQCYRRARVYTSMSSAPPKPHVQARCRAASLGGRPRPRATDNRARVHGIEVVYTVYCNRAAAQACCTQAGSIAAHTCFNRVQLYLMYR